MSKKTRAQRLMSSYGLLPKEAQELAHTSKIGLRAPYIQRFLNSRRSLYLNAKRYKWTDGEYREYLKRQYSERGCLKQDILGRIRADVWQMLRWYEERVPQRPDDYESPWKKKIKTRSTTRKTMKAITRKAMYQNWISEINKNLENQAMTPERRTRITQQRNNLQRELDKLA